ncbi:MAG: hypothetical protein HPY90_15375 [Syntrophothermus sp.]|uniref:ribonuclease toxin HepT-like protein n=1 Tax=Syntrophothermus sp. TaxID=2736299 RepID=UPI0025797B6D|nr:hypothetical protein [Syntrophothermus sp.]NSW84580.1 hypothetical protein [Syntrophothermus sp.]
MIQKLMVLRDEIEEELANIFQLKENLCDMRKKSLDPEIEKRVYASVLADFYMAVERVFKLIAKEVDGELPEGGDWHKKLLRQMSVELPGIRPPVIDKSLFHQLEEYLKFRHLVRNIYGFQLEYKRFAHLVKDMPALAEAVEQQVTGFLNDLLEIMKDLS